MVIFRSIHFIFISDNPEKNFEHGLGESETGIVDKVINSRKMTKSKRDKAQKICYAETIKPSENRTRQVCYLVD